MIESACDPDRDYVRFVAEGYDACAQAYNAARSSDAADVLAPLVADGTIRLLDETDLFNSVSGTDCSAFFDFYHNNVSGRDRLMQAIMPSLQADLVDKAMPMATR